MRQACIRFAIIVAMHITTSGRGVCADQHGFSDFAKVELQFDPPSAKPGETVALKLSITVAEGYRTYPTKQPPGSTEDAKAFVNTIRMPKKEQVIFVGDWEDPTNGEWHDPNQGDSNRYYRYRGPFTYTWTHKAVVRPDAAAGETNVTLKEYNEARKVYINSRLQVCGPVPGEPDSDKCYQSGLVFSAKLKINPGEPISVDPKYQAEVDVAMKQKAAQPVVAAVKTIEPVPSIQPEGMQTHVEMRKASPDREFEQDIEEISKNMVGFTSKNSSKPSAGGLMPFLLTAMFWGLISLVTPCVFPMIPITVSIFLKRGHHSTAATLKLATIYCLTIIVVLSISALVLLSLFQKLSTSPIMNIALGGLFVFFALSLLGMYDLVLPSFLTRFTSSHEGSGVLGTVFMALTFTIVSFTCVAPFLGGFSGMAASGNYNTFELILAAVSFSTAFAAPFFLLALFPSLLKKLPRSGSWMNSVKVVMGFLELAAALKFLRTAELGVLGRTEYFTYDLVLGMWVVLCILCGLYLLHIYKLAHDGPADHIGVVRLLIGFAFLSLGVYLTPAMFRSGPEAERQRPSGALYAWVDAFLLPEPGPGDLPWSIDLKTAITDTNTDREKTGRPRYIFVDFTGITCTNCKYNEQHIFPRPEVKALLERYGLVQLYTDTVPESFYSSPASKDVRDLEGQVNFELQRKFGTNQLPLYVILEPLSDGKIAVVDIYDEGKINHVDAFAAFLRKPLAKAAK